MSGLASWLGSRSNSPLDQLGRLRKQAGALMRDRATPAVTETAAAAVIPFRWAAALLRPVVSEHGDLIVERLQDLRARAAGTRKTFVPPRGAKRPWMAVLRPVAIAGVACVAGAAVCSMAGARRTRHLLQRPTCHATRVLPGRGTMPTCCGVLMMTGEPMLPVAC